MTDEELQFLVTSYRPSDEVLHKLAGARLLAVVGPSAVGKTSIINMAVQKSPLLQKVQDVTTREKRPGDSDTEFSFLTKEQFLAAMQKELFIQVALMPTGHLYGTLPEGYPKNKVGIMAIQSSVTPVFRRLFSGLKVVFVVPSSYEIWMEWFDRRKTTDDDTAKRLGEAKTSLEFALADKNTRFISNDTVERAVGRLIQVAEGATPDDEDRAKSIAKDNYNKLLELLNKSSNSN